MIPDNEEGLGHEKQRLKQTHGDGKAWEGTGSVRGEGNTEKLHNQEQDAPFYEKEPSEDTKRAFGN